MPFFGRRRCLRRGSRWACTRSRGMRRRDTRRMASGMRRRLRGRYMRGRYRCNRRFSRGHGWSSGGRGRRRVCRMWLRGHWFRDYRSRNGSSDIGGRHGSVGRLSRRGGIIGGND